jgi:endonuclease YncB( thermonuclease family)
MRTTFLLAMLVLGVLAPIPTSAEPKNKFLLGEYELNRNNGVIDGDTIRCWKLDGGVRLLGIDTEETFRELEDRRAAGKDWEAYAAAKAGANDLPVKYGSFMGEEASHFARDFFRGVKSVRLEYDDATRTKDIYGRHLCYAFATPRHGGQELNYCVEVVRHGYSPYAMKYGHSARFRKEFEAAENEARQAKRGIWGEKPMGYRDYDVRLKWWKERAEQLERFRSNHAKTDNAIELACEDTEERLKKHEGKEVLLLCNMPEFANGLNPDESPPRIACTALQNVTLHVCFDTRALYDECNPGSLRGYYVIVRGVLRKRGARDWQVAVQQVQDFKKA